MHNKPLILIIFFTLLIIVSAYFIRHDYEKKVYDREEKRFIAVQQKRVSLYVHENVDNVKSITFTDYERLPAGNYAVYGYINHDKELEFSADITASSNFKYNGDLNSNDAFDRLKHDINKRKSVDQIIKEKHLNPKDYEYPWP